MINLHTTMNTFCTIITGNYFPHALALYKSLKKFDEKVSLHVLVTDHQPLSGSHTATGMQILRVDALARYPLAEELYSKYAHVNMDFFRWSLKPVLMNFLLETGYEKVLFVDCDIFFFSDYRFLFDALNRSAIILTPHWYNANPAENENDFVQLLAAGYFNAGFIGSSKKGAPALQWWAHACHYRMGEHHADGIHDDQRYLDLLPLLFEDVQILSHKGCNLGAGNYETCKRTLAENAVLIDGSYPVVFIHFYKPLIEQILKGHDPLLVPYFNEYKKAFEASGVPFAYFIGSIAKQLQPSVLMQLKWKLRIRTRVKRLLYSLARKL